MRADRRCSHRRGRAVRETLDHPPSHSSRGRRVPRPASDRCPSGAGWFAVVRSCHSFSTSSSANSRTKAAASSCTKTGLFVGKQVPGTGRSPDCRHRTQVCDQPLEILCSSCTRKPGDVFVPTATAPGLGTGGRRQSGRPWTGEDSALGRVHLAASLRQGGELPGSLHGSLLPWPASWCETPRGCPHVSGCGSCWLRSLAHG